MRFNLMFDTVQNLHSGTNALFHCFLFFFFLSFLFSSYKTVRCIESVTRFQIQVNNSLLRIFHYKFVHWCKENVESWLLIHIEQVYCLSLNRKHVSLFIRIDSKLKFVEIKNSIFVFLVRRLFPIFVAFHSNES